MPKFWLMMTILTASQLAFAESFPKEDEEWQIRRPNTPSWNQEDDLPAARGRKSPSKNGPTNQEIDEIEQVEQEPKREPEKPLAEEPRDRSEPAPEEREVSSVEDPSSSRADADSPPPPPVDNRGFHLRLGLLGGISNLKSGDATSQSARAEQALTQNFFLGGRLAGRFGRYFEAEVEGFYGLAPEIELSDAQGGSAQTKRLQQQGIFASGIFRIPIGGFVPKLGGGYGVVAVGQTLVQSAIETRTSEQGAGPFLLAGVDFDLSPFVTLSADFSHAVGATGSYSNTVTNGTPTNETSDANFDRIRLGGYYRFSPRVIAGAMFHILKLSTALKPHNTTAPTGSESMSQFMFVGMTEF